MTATLLQLTYLVVVIIIGLLCSIIAEKIKIPNVLLLILAGVALNNIHYAGRPLIEFPHLFITTISIVALVMIVFDSSSRFKFKEFDAFSLNALKLTGIWLLFNLILLTSAIRYLFNVNIFISLMFATLMSGTSPDVVLIMVKDSTNKVLQMLKIESILNTPLIVLLPFVILTLIQSVDTLVLATFVQQIAPFFQQIITGIGAGVLVGLVIFKIMRKTYSETLSPLAIITAALLSYILAENLGGNGVLAVTSAGLFFGNIYVKQKVKLEEFSMLFSTFLEILVFVLVGLLISVPLTINFFLKSGSLFLIYLFIRFIAVQVSFRKADYNLKEKIFISLNAPKGIAVAVVVATLFIYSVPGTLTFIDGIKTLLDLSLIFMIYSILVSSIIIKLSKFFVRAQVIK